MANYIRTPDGFFQSGSSGLVPITDPVQLRDLSSGKTPYMDEVGGLNKANNPNWGIGTMPQANVASPVGTQGAAPQAPTVPLAPPGGTQSVPGAPTPVSQAGTPSPYANFGSVIMDALKGAQQGTTSGGMTTDQFKNNLTDLTNQRERVNNQALNLSNPMNATPYSSLFKMQAPGVALGNEQGTQQAFAPAVGSINDSMQLQKDLMTAQTEQQKSNYVTIPYGGSVYDKSTGQTLGSGVTDPQNQGLISQAMQENRLDPSLLTRYGTQSIIATLQQDPNFDFNTMHTGYQRGIQTSQQVVTNPVTGEQYINYTKGVPGSSGAAPASGAPQGAPVSGGTPQPVAQSGGLPKPATKIQADYEKDFTSGKIGTQINAINTAIGHLFEASNNFQQLNNGDIPLLNQFKNVSSTAIGKAAQQNYEQAQKQFSAEISNAYGADALADRIAQQAIGSSNNSPQQHAGFVATAGSLLASKITSQAQQYRTAMGAPIPSLDLLISPQNQSQLSTIGLRFVLNGNGEVGTYQKGPDSQWHIVNQ